MLFQNSKNMYDNSSTRIKLIKKLSDSIKINNGVEQGHPLSPELFKIFIRDLSQELNIEGPSPTLVTTPVSHLLWADDLVLLSLNESHLQDLLNKLHDYCSIWGLEINIKKTKVMIFNKAGRLITPNQPFKLGDLIVEVTKTYCYLGIVFTASGSFKEAISELRKKSLRALYSLKTTINVNQVTYNSCCILFDSLIKPILTYGSQIWFIYTSSSKAMSKCETSNIPHSDATKHATNFWTCVARDPFEKSTFISFGGHFVCTKSRQI